MCRTPKIANVVRPAVVQRERHQKEVPLVETSQPIVPNKDEEEDDVEEEVSCFKEAITNGNSQLNLSSQQRDGVDLMADTPSPAPSVISIHSELTDGEDERDEDSSLRG